MKMVRRERLEGKEARQRQDTVTGLRSRVVTANVQLTQFGVF